MFLNNFRISASNILKIFSFCGIRYIVQVFHSRKSTQSESRHKSARDYLGTLFVYCYHKKLFYENVEAVKIPENAERTEAGDLLTYRISWRSFVVKL